jgi:hypothetical protein
MDQEIFAAGLQLHSGAVVSRVGQAGRQARVPEACQAVCVYVCVSVRTCVRGCVRACARAQMPVRLCVERACVPACLPFDASQILLLTVASGLVAFTDHCPQQTDTALGESAPSISD